MLSEIEVHIDKGMGGKIGHALIEKKKTRKKEWICRFRDERLLQSDESSQLGPMLGYPLDFLSAVHSVIHVGDMQLLEVSQST